MRWLWLLPALVALFQDNPRQGPRARTDGPLIGRKIEGFEDLLKDRKALVIAFTSSDCPLSKLYRPKLIRIEKEYRDRGVGFLLVYCDFEDSPDRTGIDFPVRHDRDGTLGRRLQAEMTTDTFVLDPSGNLRYRGAIDDQYGFGYKLETPKRRYVIEALQAVLAGHEVKTVATDAPGCPIESRPEPKKGAKVTFHGDVLPIFEKHCIDCHQPGRIGPFTLETYSQARKSAKRIRAAVVDGRMPPWHANPKYGQWSNERRLTGKEIDTIVDWVDAGAPEGKGKKGSRKKTRPAEWLIGKPDVIYETPRPFRVPAEGAIPYRYAYIKTKFEEDRWVQAAELQPGDPEVVHHILTFLQYPLRRAKEQPKFDGGLRNGYFAALVPGQRPNVYPENAGKLLPAGSTIIFQIHYIAIGRAATDRSRIGLRFHKKPPRHEVLTRGIVNQSFRIPPEAANHEVRATFRFEKDARILAFMPHLHVRGKAFRYTAVLPNRKEEILLDIPGYDFNWQNTYRYVKPRRFPMGARIVATAVYDNSSDNPANPDPTEEVRWGLQTWEEMMIGYMDIIED